MAADRDEIRGSNLEKDPDEWVTGEEPMDENLSKADASKRIDELQDKTGRGS